MKSKHKRGTNSITFTFLERTLENKQKALCTSNDKTLKYLLSKKPTKAIMTIVRGMSEKKAKRINSPFTYLSGTKAGEQLTFLSSTRPTHPDFKFTPKNFLEWMCEEAEIDTEKMEEQYDLDGEELEWYEDPLNIKWITVQFFY